MATNNFMNENASNIYVITNDKMEFDYMADNEILAEDIKSFLPDLTIYNDYDVYYENRSYPSIRLGEICEEVTTNKDIYIMVCVTLVLRSGYYEAYNLDYEYNINIDDDTLYDDDSGIDEFLNEYKDAFELTDDEIVDITEETDEVLSRLISKVEDVYSKLSETYKQLGTFSNGEGIYERA